MIYDTFIFNLSEIKINYDNNLCCNLFIPGHDKGQIKVHKICPEADLGGREPGPSFEKQNW